MARTRKLFSAHAADGNSAIARVKHRSGAQSEMELIGVQISGSMNGCTITAEVSLNGDESPSAWTGLVDAEGTAIAAMTTTGAYALELPSGTWFRFVLSGSGSPEPSVTVRAYGDL